MTIKERLNKFVNSGWYIVLVGVLAFLTYALGIYSYVRIVAFVLLACCFVFLGNVKSIIMPLLIYKLAIHPNIDSSVILSVLFHASRIFLLIALGYLVVCKLKSGQKLKTGKLFWGIVAAIVAILISGVMYTPYTSEFFASNYVKLIIALFQVFALYFLFINFLKEEKNFPKTMFSFEFLTKLKNSENKIKKETQTDKDKSNRLGEYILFALIITGLVVVAELVLEYIRSGDILHAMQNKLVRVAGNRINGPALYIGMASITCLYFATVKKQKAVWLGLMTLLFIGLLTTFSRGVTLFTIVFLVVGIVYAIYRTENKKKFVISLASIIVTLLIVFGVFHKQIIEIFSYFGKMGLSDNGRKYWWKLALKYFRKSPIFGIGFFGDDGGAFPRDIWYFHNTLLQILACAGIVGVIGFSLFYFQRYKLLLSNWSVMQFFVLISILIFELYGMIDINSFRPEQVAMVILLCVVVELEPKESKLPFRIDRKGQKSYNKRSLK